MMSPRVLVASMYDRKVIAPALERLTGQADVILGPELGRDITECEIIPLLKDIDAVIAADEPYTARVFASAPRLKLIGRDGVGFNAIDLAAATRHGVVVANTPVIEETVADLTFALMLAIVRRIAVADRGVREGRWTERARYVGSDVYGKTLGILGLGRVGRAVARRAAGFGMTVLAHDVQADTTAAEELGVRLVELEGLLASSDILCIHAPLTEETRGLIDGKAIERMKDGAFLINMARGKVIDQDALVHALQHGKLAGAGLDVFVKEPPDPDDPILKLDNVVLTPHVGGDTVDAFRRVFDGVVENILRFLQGKRPMNVLNPDVFEQRS